MVTTMLLLIASGTAAPIAREPATLPSPPRDMIVARLPLRSITAGPPLPCATDHAEAPRPWTPEKDVIGVPADCAWPTITVTGQSRRARLPAAHAVRGEAGDSARLRLVEAALPYLQGAVGGGAFAVALTGRLMLVRGARPDMRFDISHSGRAGATSYVTAPDPSGLSMRRPERF